MDELTLRELHESVAQYEGEDLQRAILGELIQLNARLARAESGVIKFAKGRNAKAMLMLLTSKSGVRW